MLLAMSSNYSRSAQPYVTQVWLSFVENYQLGSLHTECGFPFRLGILSIRQTVAQTVFSLPRNHRTLFHRPTHCLEELLFACKWGVQKTNVLQLKPIGCINARVNLDKCLFYSYRRCLKKYLFPIQLFLRIWPTRYYRETYLLRSGSNMLTSLNIARNNAILKCC